MWHSSFSVMDMSMNPRARAIEHIGFYPLPTKNIVHSVCTIDLFSGNMSWKWTQRNIKLAPVITSHILFQLLFPTLMLPFELEVISISFTKSFVSKSVNFNCISIFLAKISFWIGCSHFPFYLLSLTEKYKLSKFSLKAFFHTNMLLLTFMYAWGHQGCFSLHWKCLFIYASNSLTFEVLNFLYGKTLKGNYSQNSVLTFHVNRKSSISYKKTFEKVKNNETPCTVRSLSLVLCYMLKFRDCVIVYQPPTALSNKLVLHGCSIWVPDLTTCSQLNINHQSGQCIKPAEMILITSSAGTPNFIYAKPQHVCFPFLVNKEAL